MEDQVFLEISSMKGVMRFGKKRKLSLRYIGPFEVVSCVGNVAYRMALIEWRYQLGKVLWRNHSIEEAKCEVEVEMKEKCPYLFKDQGEF